MCAAALWLAGCHAPAQPGGPTEIVLRIPDYDRYVDASLSLLRWYDFPPDRVDRTSGLIVTRPTTSGQWFEPWRRDVLGGYQRLESNLHTVRRVVTVRIEPLVATTGAAEAASAGAAGEASTTETAPATQEQPETQPSAGSYRVTVRVDKARLTTPERQVTTASGALVMYSRHVPTTEGTRATAREDQWVPVGRDGLLEADLLNHLADVTPGVEVAE